MSREPKTKPNPDPLIANIHEVMKEPGRQENLEKIVRLHELATGRPRPDSPPKD